MSKKTLTLDADSVKAEPRRSGAMSVEIDGVDSGEVLDHFTPAEAVGHFYYADLLDEIGEEKAREHFGIE